MAYKTFQLGAFNFAGITGSLSIAAPVERLRIEHRIGVDGFEITALGSMGQQSQLITFRDLTTWEDGFSLHEDHRALIGAGPQSLTVNGYSFASIGIRVVVLDVQKVEHYRSSLIVGNKLENSPTAVISERWTVITKSIV